MKTWVLNKIIAYAKRTPYSHIGDYMHRYWIVPYRYEYRLKWYRNPIGYILQKFDIAIRVHEILRSDDASSKHCHPWSYFTVILKNGYREITEIRDAHGAYVGDRDKYYGAGSILFRRAETRHRLELCNGQTAATTLFVTFRRTRMWGFYPNPETFVPHKEYLKNGRK